MRNLMMKQFTTMILTVCIVSTSMSWDGLVVRAESRDVSEGMSGNEADDVGEMEATGEINSKDDPTLTCSGSISGTLWHDENSDGIWDEVEAGIADYPVSLYQADDRSNAVQTATTDADGQYAFANIECGIYVVGVKSSELGADHYMLPIEGVTGDNKFGIWSNGGNEKYSDFITMERNTTVTDVNAGLWMPLVAQVTSTTATVVGTEVTFDGLAAGGLQMEIEGILMDNRYPAISTPDDITKLTVIGAMSRSDLNYIWRGSYDVYMSEGQMNGITTLELSGVTLEEMTGFPDHQFAYNTVLQTVTLPTGLGYLGNYTFESCTSLTNVDLSDCTGMSYVGEGTFESCTGLTSIGTSGMVDVLLPTGLGFLGDGTFYDCISLTSVDLSGCMSMTYLGEDAFGLCTSLTGIGTSGVVGVLLPTGLDCLGDYAFYGCESLTSVDLSGCTSMTCLGEGTFKVCESLTSVDLSDCISMIYVGEETFNACKNLTSVILSGIPHVVAISGNGLYDTFERTNGVKVFVPYVLLASYQGNPNWSYNVSAYNVKLLADQTKPADSTGNDKINNNKNHNSSNPVGNGKQVTLTANKDVKTGDSSNPWLWVVLTITSLGVLAVMGCKKRRDFGRKDNKRFLC